jgi:ubiquinone/menaquinone biosynthesis C-methylase UbiE
VKYGGDRVTKSDILHKVEGNPDATIVADLSNANRLSSNTFDTIIFTQTLQFIYDIKSTVATLYRILKPSGVVLATMAGMAQISREDFEMWGEYWRFTSLSARYLFEEFFPKQNIAVRSYGNVLAAISFLEGLAAEDLKKRELDTMDPNYELIVAVRAVKPEVTK